MGGVKLFDRGGLPADDYQTLADRLAETGLTRPRVLGWAPTVGGGVAVGLVDRFVVMQGEEWLQVCWHEIYSGGWDHVEQSIRWSTLDAPRRDRRVTLTRPGKLPDVFRERVEQSIVMQQLVDLDDAGHQVLVSARRELGAGDSEIRWTVLPGRGTNLNRPELREQADAVLARFRSEWAF